MPNRILKESIRTSKKVNQISDFSFRLWAYLITYVDDFGRGSADIELLQSFLFPRKRNITESQLKKALTELCEANMIQLYTVDGDAYLFFPNWDEHQTIRNKKSKFPEPENICNQLYSTDSKCLRNPIQSNPNPNPNPNTNTTRGRASESELEADFEEAWFAYPRREGNKSTARKAYIKARKNGTSKETILSGAIAAANHYANTDPQYIPQGATWFNGQRWNDEYLVKQNLTTKDIAKSMDFTNFLKEKG